MLSSFALTCILKPAIFTNINFLEKKLEKAQDQQRQRVRQEAQLINRQIEMHRAFHLYRGLINHLPHIAPARYMILCKRRTNHAFMQ